MVTLVTGLSGFVGTHCARLFPAAELALEGKRVDLRDRTEVLEAVNAVRPDSVIHLAAQSSVAVSIDAPEATFDVNFQGTLNLLAALRASGFRGRMLYVGSADTYGFVREAELPVVEDRPLRPLNPYAVSKVAAEALCYQWSQSGSFEIVLARPFNHIGPGQAERFAIASFARQIAAARAGRGERRLKVGDVELTRDLTDVRDVVRAYASLLASGRNGEAYNVCSGVERKLRDVVQLLLAGAGVELPIEVDPSLLRPTEQRRMAGSFAKLQADTGWQPEISLDQTLRDMLSYWTPVDGRD
jgi:GDP-4-dehydro-6-deoxy-D-mannose reductase